MHSNDQPPRSLLSDKNMRHILEWHGFHAVDQGQGRFLEHIGETEIREMARKAAEQAASQS